MHPLAPFRSVLALTPLAVFPFHGTRHGTASVFAGHAVFGTVLGRTENGSVLPLPFAVPFSLQQKNDGELYGTEYGTARPATFRF